MKYWKNLKSDDNAKFDNFVSGQGVNEVLAEAQFIICSMAKMGTKELSGDGTYKATLYSDECEQAGAASTDSSQGTTAPSSASSSSSSSTAATAGTDNTAREIDTVMGDLKKFGLVSVSRTGAVAMTRGSEIFK